MHDAARRGGGARLERVELHTDDDIILGFERGWLLVLAMGGVGQRPRATQAGGGEGGSRSADSNTGGDGSTEHVPGPGGGGCELTARS